MSFDLCSRPLIQIDTECSCGKEAVPGLFPEGLYDPSIGNVWVYLSAPLDIDICIVVGVRDGGAWSGFFRNHRCLSV